MLIHYIFKKKQIMELVYGLVCPLNGEIMYIGKTKNQKNRYLSHLSESLSYNSFSPKDCWIKSLLFQGLVPEFTILSSGLDSKSVLTEEIKLINDYSEGQLTNKKDNPFDVNEFYSNNFDNLIIDIIKNNSLEDVIFSLNEKLLINNSIKYYKNEIKLLIELICRQFLKVYKLNMNTSVNYDINKAKLYCKPKYFGLTLAEIENDFKEMDIFNNLFILLESSEKVKEEYNKMFG